MPGEFHNFLYFRHSDSAATARSAPRSDTGTFFPLVTTSRNKMRSWISGVSDKGRDKGRYCKTS